MTDLLAAHRHTQNNRSEVEASTRCGCCSCMSIFPPEEIVGWDGLEVSDFNNPDSMNSGTAMCPSCGSAAVLGDKSGYSISPEFLNRMNQAWFEQTIVRRSKPRT